MRFELESKFLPAKRIWATEAAMLGPFLPPLLVTHLFQLKLGRTMALCCCNAQHVVLPLGSNKKLTRVR